MVLELEFWGYGEIDWNWFWVYGERDVFILISHKSLELLWGYRKK